MKIYKITEASKYLGISINSLKTLANNVKLNSFKTSGEHRRFREDDLDAYMGVKKEKQERLTVIYARCSTAKQKENLERQKDRLRKHGFHLGVNWFQHHMDSKLLAKDWNGGLVDICFVDGAHSYDECLGDVIAWEPLIRKGGFMVIHDYNKQLILPDSGKFHSDGPHPMAWLGVNRVVDEYLKSKYEVLEQVKSTIVFRIS